MVLPLKRHILEKYLFNIEWFGGAIHNHCRCHIPFHIRSHIEKAGHTCELRDAAEFRSPAEVAHLLSQKHAFEAALAIHLFRAGRLLLGKHLSFYVMCFPILIPSVISVCVIIIQPQVCFCLPQ